MAGEIARERLRSGATSATVGYNWRAHLRNREDILPNAITFHTDTACDLARFDPVINRKAIEAHTDCDRHSRA